MSQDLLKYMKKIDSSLVFDGEELTIKIPQKYEDKGMLIISNNVTALSIFEIEILDKGKTEIFKFMLPSMIEFEYTSVKKLAIYGKAYYSFKLSRGDKFLVNTTLLKNGDIPAKIFAEFFSIGNMPPFIPYSDISSIFGLFKTYCNFGINVSHTVLEMIVAHLSRDEDNLSTKYRLSKMNKPLKFLGLNNIEFGTEGTNSKITGAYFVNGVNTALVNQSDQNYELEDLLRR